MRHTQNRTRREQQAWQKFRKQIGPNIWSGKDLLKAFAVGTLLGMLLVASQAMAVPYDICIISDAPEPACFVLDTPLPKDEIIALVEYPSGDYEVSIAGVNLNLDCKDTDGDGFDDECLMSVEAADSPYHAYGVALSISCVGNTLLTQKADGEGGTYTNSQYNSIQCGYEAPDDDPCFRGSWYVGYGNPECEAVDDMDYRVYCTSVEDEGVYGLATRTACPAQ